MASRTLCMWVDEDGMVALRGGLTPEVGAALLRGVEAAPEAWVRARCACPIRSGVGLPTLP